MQNNDKPMEEDDAITVDCEQHGRGIAAVVYRQLCNDLSRNLGFIENSSVPGDRRAWCSECEQFFLQQGELTEEFRRFNDMALVCQKRFLYLLLN